MSNGAEIATWWGRHKLAPDRHDIWHIGPLDLAVERTTAAWTVRWRYVRRAADDQRARRRSLNAADATSVLSGGFTPSALSPYYHANFESVTLPVSNPNEDLIFSPCLPERTVSMPLATTVFLEPSERLTIGVLIPLVVRVELASPHGGVREACEVALEPLCETWMGASPLLGEMALTPHRPELIANWAQHRPRLDGAAVAVTVKNIGAGPTLLDRIAIPCPKLALFHSPQSGFWTESLNLDGREEDMGTTWFQRTDKALPSEAANPQLVAHSRHHTPDSAAFKKLTNIKNSLGGLFKDRG